MQTEQNYSLSKEKLTQAAARITRGFVGSSLRESTLQDIWGLMTVTQYITDLCLNEVERRGELTYHLGRVIVPYMSEHSVQTVLTRGCDEINQFAVDRLATPEYEAAFQEFVRDFVAKRSSEAATQVS